ncbi:hypothetical protein [Fimbriiglobus ruber]|uniref:Uncharacterized protein n=1 Tax=Fimbriiglobus ruber TaxID=1908690 RepID=A0A225DNN0_9BACT|nr:hypothetical protein [Fimbriiglobus ruber]OWK39086.1 hypothetical protein FRUB_06168 [Fimbriiglobus ruber]
MSEPSGKIVARPMVVRACGHQQEFQHYEKDKFRAQRLAKFQGSRCAECVAKLQEEQRRSQGIPKAEALKSLPAGAQVSLTLLPGDTWQGTLTALGKTVEIVGPVGAGPQAVVVAMARLWAVDAGQDEEK